jgi:hypothetical protein
MLSVSSKSKFDLTFLALSKIPLFSVSFEKNMSWIIYNNSILPAPICTSGLTILAVNTDPKYSNNILERELKEDMKANHETNLDDKNKPS